MLAGVFRRSRDQVRLPTAMRATTFSILDVLQQQLCWAHVIRQLTEISERDGVTGRRGCQLVALARKVIAAHRQYLEHRHQPEWLAEQLAPLREQIRTLLEQCAAGQHQRTANFAASPPGCWTSTTPCGPSFVDVPDANIDPTNNTAERAMRHPVLQRRLQGGTQSDRGNRWIERIQSVRETCRLQDRLVLDWLIDAITAAHHGQPIPRRRPHKRRCGTPARERR